MKNKLSSYPVLAFPRIGEPFVVQVDASDHAVGGVLSQGNANGEWHPVAYFSTTLTAAQKKWSTHSKEAFAAIMAIRHWHVYLAGTEFVIKSDHDPLVRLRSKKDPRGKFARWITELEEYNYKIEYIPGKSNTVADALSRNENAIENTSEEFEDKIFTVIDLNSDFSIQLKQEQYADLIISNALKQVEKGEKVMEGRLKRVNKQLRVENGLLTKSGRPVLPPSLRKYVVEKVHSIAHFGCDKIYDVLKSRFYWPNMFRYISLFTASCETCQKCKADAKAPKAPLIPFYVTQSPMEFISIDIQHMPSDDNNNKYVLLIGDIFSKCIEAVPMVDQTASQVIDGLYKNWILKYGCPKFILSDQASNVDGKLIHEVCETFNIKKRRTSAYHSQGNGFAERCIRNIREILHTILLSRGSPQKDWSKYLEGVVFALNTSLSKSTKCTPYKVVFGRDPVLPEDVFWDVNDNSMHRDITTASEYAEELKIVLKKIYEQVNEQLKLTRDEMEKQYNKTINLNDYKVGNAVWLKRKHYKTGESKKLSPRKSGPWEIIETLEKIIETSCFLQNIIQYVKKHCFTATNV